MPRKAPVMSIRPGIRSNQARMTGGRGRNGGATNVCSTQGSQVRHHLCGGGAISCIVRNVSATGASLEIESPVGIPERFNLLLDRASLKCRVVWRKERRIGVRLQIAP